MWISPSGSVLMSQRKMKPSVLINGDDSRRLQLTVCNAPVAFPNALRRCILADVPTFTIEKVGVMENTVRDSTSVNVVVCNFH